MWSTPANPVTDWAAEIMWRIGFFGLVEKETNPTTKNSFFLDELNQLVLWSVAKSNLSWREEEEKKTSFKPFFFFFCNRLS